MIRLAMCRPHSYRSMGFREHVLKYENALRFCFCASGICLAYWYYGVIQESLVTHSGLGATFLLVMQAVANIVVAKLWQGVQSARREDYHFTTAAPKKISSSLATLHHSLLLLTSGVYVFSMVFANESLRFVSYPTAVLAKSCKLIPTMIMGSLVERRRYSNGQWLSAVFISAGISSFHLSRVHHARSSDDSSDAGDESWKGMILLTLSLAMDGFLGSCQGLLKREDKHGRRRPPTAVETMLWVNGYALFFLVPMAIVSGQWREGIQILSDDNPALIYSIVALNAVVAVGQIFIFLTLTWYSSLVCTTITTTRKFFTILFSVLYFGHQFSLVQWAAVALVFGGLYLSTFSKVHSDAQSDTHVTKNKKEN